MIPPRNEQLLRLGTRASLLARQQSQQVANALERAHPPLRVELVLVKTTGDRITDRALHEFGGKGLFTKELENALLAGEIDIAVHSLKDVPVTMPLVDRSQLTIAAVTQREDPRDVLVSKPRWSIAQLPRGARVGTGSFRRKAQLLQLRPDLSIEPIRGNVDTRLKRALTGDLDAVVLAHAGLHRCGLFDETHMFPLELDEMLPAAAQGALAIQCRRDDARAQSLARALNDGQTATCVEIERAVVDALEGDCHSPIAALATIGDGRLELRAAVAARGGAPPVIRAAASAPASEPRRALGAAVRSLRDQGAVELLGTGQTSDASPR